MSTDAPSAEPSRAFRVRRARNWIFLGLMYGFFYMSRYNFSAIAQQLGDIFGWTNQQYGNVISTGALFYGLSVFLNGPLADKMGGKRAILVGAAGAAVFNLGFGLCFVFLKAPAVVNSAHTVVTPALLAHGMTTTTMLATFASLWAANHVFQSFGALSIVKINASWFHVRERGVFAGIFGVMIQGGRWLAFAMSPFILRFLPWQYCFWIPSAILVVMWFVNRFLVENNPADAGLGDYPTGDESKDEAATPATLGFVLKKIFARPTMWLIALSSMCIGMVRNSVDHFWSKYVSTVFDLHGAQLGTFAPYQFASWAMPASAILGGLVAGTVSDKIFQSRRAPVICFAFIGQLAGLFVLSRVFESAWLGCLMLAVISFFIQSAHSMVGGAASMDFGGRKAVATAAGLFDGAQYLAGAIVGTNLGKLLDHYKDPAHHGAEYFIWPLAPMPFAFLGAILIGLLWNARPTARSAH